MTQKALRARLSAFVILPFRAMISPFTVSAKLPGDSHVTAFGMSYPASVPLAPASSLDTRAWTAVNIETEVSLPEDATLVPGWFHNTGQGRLIFRGDFLPRINAFILRLKNARPDASYTGVFRNVGDVDVVFYSLFLDGKPVYSRATSTMYSSRIDEQSHFDASVVDFSIAVPHEWGVLTRAVDLVNHGYHLEGFVAGFALLDALVQDFARKKLQERGLDEEEASQFLRKIESERLKTYLGAVLRIAGGKSPLSDSVLKKDLDWLNTKRNKVMHGGTVCSYEDASRGLRIVAVLVQALNDCGASYSVPAKLEFW